MRRQILLDTGPLVAVLNRRDPLHAWALERFAEIEPPLLTCEAVVVEACHLLRNQPRGERIVLDILQRGVAKIGFSLQKEALSVQELRTRYANVPMDLADACLVRMAELFRGSSLLTLDSDFRIYRKQGRRVIQTIMPPGL